MGNKEGWKTRRRNATRRRLEMETDALAQGWADCEAAFLAGLRAMAAKEQATSDRAKTAAIAAPVHDEAGYRTARERHVRHEARAACLQELAFAVASGQLRTDAYDEEALAWAHRTALQGDAQAQGRAGGLKAAAGMTPEQRQARARAAGLARGRKNGKEEV